MLITNETQNDKERKAEMETLMVIVSGIFSKVMT